ncbi:MULTISPECIES: lysine N(6)-hydroxylase/L-ornithine N(5)-oxygenase family protein [Streptomyces]|uniref:L-lysine N6-monooxygenase MbtG n=1 Tax=Streptomyces tsukubensis (strain DSM 42081 / NBRC 108919 / NRRL 18488 / 9993) TaxID=1114943 RepID=I2MWJ7_STRT9|nr:MULTISPECIES: SidA/IucD/PvdA family monooxygenase [Streptomyces]AZK93582.1 lysine 6-monooxygenase [Streptomyces tsukubensis]EIF89144.1 monooxygenase [Streptomyces tsukubensis NRRL18488]MYS66760.1 SidA/IucD/PvdA family monooxygenase [Streptomyces sp. SID5473]QKM70269.1 lysine 6-monooxygenase [Streptomyces tsukubensis NRRL18488]TAI45749.1 lysine 6-monooxygenase [Streptomyces tsukubensis]
MTGTPAPDQPGALDLVGIGIGPANLSLAALADGVPGGLDTAFYEQRPHFGRPGGPPVEDAALRVPFLADLVTLADPASPWSFLRFLRSRDRLFPFCAAERFRIDRAEYDAYCRWVAEALPGLHFGHQVDAVRWNPEHQLFEIDFTRTGADGQTTAPGRTRARSVAVGIGTEPYVPETLRPLADTPTVPVVHSADYLRHRDTLLAAGHITVVGSGQSGAEVFLDLLRTRPEGREGLHWITRTEAFAPREHSGLGLEHLTPDYTRYFHALPQDVRDGPAPRRRQRHQGIDAATLAAVHDELYRRSLHGGWPDAVLTPGVRVRTAGRVATTRVELHLEHVQQGTRSRLTTDAVVLATGYRERPLARVLTGLDPYLRRDAAGRPRIDEDFRLLLDPSVTGTVFVQSADAAGPGPAAWRSASILNTLTGREPYRLPHRTAFTGFGLEPRDAPRIPGQDRRLTPLAQI